MEMFGQFWLRGVLKLIVFETVFVMGDSGKPLDSEMKELEHFIKQTVACRKVPGLAVSAVKNDKVIFSRGYGHSDIERDIKATEHTEFCVGSLTKAFTSTIIADVLSKHTNLSWDTKIKDILGPTFQLSDDLRTENANIRDILSHKLGTPSNFHALLVGFPANMSRAELVEKLRYMPACSEFRAKFHYSNYMYMLAGYVAEMISGESWENLVAKRLLHRLGMRSTGFVDNGGNLNSMAVPYVLKGDKLIPIDKELLLAVSPSGPAGSVYSTASDMAKWIMFHLRGGKNIHGHQLVNRKWLQETYESQMTHPFGATDLTKPTYPISDATLSYDMGWMSSLYRGYRKLWHSGGIVTFVSQLWLFPDENAGVFVTASGPMSPQGSTAVKSIAARVSDFLLQQEPWLNMSTTCTYPAPWEEPPPDTMATEQVTKYEWNITQGRSSYVGKYGNKGFGEIHIYAENDDSLVLEYGRFGKMDLYPVSEEEFNGHYVDKLWFVTNSDGSVRPVSITFVFNLKSKVTGLLFPIDSESDKTLFSKGATHNARKNTPQQPYTLSTSHTCSSGMAALFNSHAPEMFLAFICYFYLLS